MQIIFGQKVTKLINNTNNFWPKVTKLINNTNNFWSKSY